MHLRYGGICNSVIFYKTTATRVTETILVIDKYIAEIWSRQSFMLFFRLMVYTVQQLFTLIETYENTK